MIAFGLSRRALVLLGLLAAALGFVVVARVRQSEPRETEKTAEKQSWNRSPETLSPPILKRSDQHDSGTPVPTRQFALIQITPHEVALQLGAAQFTFSVPSDIQYAPVDRSITGRVTKEDGIAARGAVILAGEWIRQSDSELVTASFGTEADEQGNYSLRVLSEKDLFVMALDRNVGWSEPVGVRAAKSDSIVDLTIPQPGALRGTATYSGAPVEVEAMLLARGIGSLSFERVSAGDGSFLFQRVPPGAYSLITKMHLELAGGWAPQTHQEVTILAGQTTVVDVELPEGVLVAAVVQYPEGREPQTVSYAFEPRDRAGPEPQFRGLYGGIDAMKVVQYHDTKPGEYRLCVKMKFNRDDPGVSRCTWATIAAAPAIQEIVVDLR